MAISKRSIQALRDHPESDALSIGIGIAAYARRSVPAGEERDRP